MPSEHGVLSLAAAPSEYGQETADMSAPGEYDTSQQGMDADYNGDMETPFAAQETLSPPSSSK